MNNSKDSIEYKLLSRCSNFNNEKKIVDALDSRYSLTGSQKNYLILKPTEGDNNTSKNKKRKKKSLSILRQITSNTGNNNNNNNNKFNGLRTRNEFKTFIKNNLKLQKNLNKKLSCTTNSVESFQEFNEILKFEDFIKINELWNSYLKNLLSVSNNKLPNVQAALSKLSSADLIGSFITVIKSSTYNNVGIAGIVIWESQYNFIIVTPRNNNWKDDINIPIPTLSVNYTSKEKIGGIRIISKRNTIFGFYLPINDQELIEFSVIGNRFLIKSYDRANKKFKNHNVNDLI
ncbi:hypothetical protein PACTADRAFT_1136 [Pachysolen tannophilus NRRL Y-2460]|uniref:Ribonuclease P protein subunit n=1 Tax=Pachysolen tannophilus NRRL Y-2460 TaxID=669874 RepID=A0A1E4TY01_PACTA|nr:hypothetical protein PACTADRAFT_1136 [Pachysolen tannophilus NRRL Y-2460]